ncbi:hypothetical protein [Hymenobacter cheonanensis]|uniref:hypothetical protein n=1 Tax=Hymenobacter sp. CA2-7 TaxID=3063993 RepID=UPI0027135A74|nr:hypothetical protein [Hymenobacter sp. CA2-7]MDO7885437.1 hypothetical protein [Hymenobacter sp. CA2-7]
MKFLLATLGLLLALSPARAQSSAAAGGPACHGCAFSDDIDKTINLCQALVANGDSCEPHNLLRLVPTQPGAPAPPDEAEDSFTTSKAVPWSAWSGHLEWLSWYLPPPNPTKPLAGTAGQYTRLPNAAGRQLFLAGDGPTEPGLLLEFQGTRFRFILLNYEARGSSEPHFYHHADCDLLVLTNTDGVISKIYNASTTWLSIFDLRSNTWLLDAVVEADGDEDSNWATQRHYQVKDAGRTVVLGPYRDAKGRYQSALLTGKARPRSNYNLPPGTYQLRDGRYQRAIAQPPVAARPGLAPAPRRPAVSAAEVNGTFRDAQGRELALLALGGGRLRVGFRDAATNTAGVYHRHTFTYEASIVADSAVLQLPPYAGSPASCSLRLHFERPGTLQVHENGAGCTAEAVGTYTKISADKPTFN